jgi:hypothetical protein
VKEIIQQNLWGNNYIISVLEFCSFLKNLPYKTNNEGKDFIEKHNDFISTFYGTKICSKRIFYYHKKLTFYPVFAEKNVIYNNLLKTLTGPILGCRPAACKDLMRRPSREFFKFWLILNVDVINSSTCIRAKSKSIMKMQIKFEVQNFIFLVS